jgi:meiotic recombination protein SPO11
LFDNDPDGIRILKCYLYGSKALAQEQVCILPEMEWIGLKSEDLVTFIGGENLSLPLSIPLSIRDRAVAISMLSSEEWRDEEGYLLPGLNDCHVELRRMLWLNLKAEIQILDNVADGLYGWLTRKLSVRLGEGQT